MNSLFSKPKGYRLALRTVGRRVRPRGHGLQQLRLPGLRQRRSSWERALPGLGLLAAGALVGAGLVMLFAPERVLRSDRRSQRSTESGGANPPLTHAQLA